MKALRVNCESSALKVRPGLAKRANKVFSIDWRSDETRPVTEFYSLRIITTDNFLARRLFTSYFNRWKIYTMVAIARELIAMKLSPPRSCFIYWWQCENAQLHRYIFFTPHRFLHIFDLGWVWRARLLLRHHPPHNFQTSVFYRLFSQACSKWLVAAAIFSYNVPDSSEAVTFHRCDHVALCLSTTQVSVIPHTSCMCPMIIVSWVIFLTSFITQNINQP